MWIHCKIYRHHSNPRYPSSKGSSVSRHPCRLVASVNHCKVDSPVSGRTKKQRRRRKTWLKKWIRAASNLIALIPSRLIRQMLAIFFLELNSKGLHQSSGKEKESCCLVFPSSTKREIRHFHVVVVQRRLRNVQKSVMHVQSCCFANINLLLCRRSHCRRRSRYLSSLPVRKCVQFYNWCSAWLNHLPLAKHVLGGATYSF